MKPNGIDKPMPSFRTNVRNGTWRLVRVLLLAYLVICLLMSVLETQLVYPIPPVQEIAIGAEDNGLEEVVFHSADGTKLHGLFCLAVDSPRALLVCHGNGEDVARNVRYIQFLRNHFEANIFLFDYRGYGQSAGSPHEAGVIEDGLAAQRWLAERMGVQTDETFLVGQSLGGGVTVAIAKQQGARGVILISTFSELASVAANHYRWLPIRLLMRNKYRSEQRIKDYHGPLLQFHGTADRIVPIASGMQLFEAAVSDKKQFIEIPGGGHNDRLHKAAFDQILKFLDNEQPLP